jgi:hypothetical protein
MKNILAYVKHQLSADDYIWQVFGIPNDADNVINYLTSRGYSTKEYCEHEQPRQRKPRVKRVSEPTGGQHLADVWRRSVIIPPSCPDN